MQVFATSKVMANNMAMSKQHLKHRQTVSIMKITSILLLVASMHLSAKGLSQTITLNVKKGSIREVFKSIEKQTKYVFFYQSEWVKDAKKVTITVNNSPVEQVLDLCFKGQPFDYSISGTLITIIRKNEVAEVKVSIANQLIDIKGRVINENGEPVLASIAIKGTNKGTTTNTNGEFYLTNVSKDAILILSGVGIEPVELKLTGSSYLSITVKTAVKPLDETVVKGYYTTSKRLNTGNVTKVTGQAIEKQPVGNILHALEGRIPGLFITQSSGTPGVFAKVQLRGLNSIENGNDPLFVIDGVPFTSKSLTSTIGGGGLPTSPLSNLNPFDIESIEVLKDADATAIYGSRGANGVILITTKKGKQGKTQVDFNYYTGWGKVTRMMDLLNTEQYLQMRREAFVNDGTAPNASDYDINGTWDTTRYTDWQKLFIGETSHINDAQLSFSGGNALTKYLLSGNFRSEPGTFPGKYTYQKGGVHFNISNTSTNQKYNLSISGTYSMETSVLPPVDGSMFILLPPNAPAIYDKNGDLNWENNTWTNPYGQINNDYKTNTFNLVANALLRYMILPGLEIKTSLGYNNYRLEDHNITRLSSFAPGTTNPGLRKHTFSNNGIKTWTVEPQIEYTKRCAGLNFSAILGSTFTENAGSALRQTAIGFSSDELIENLTAASSVKVNQNDNSTYRYNALFGRIGINYKEKYLVNFTARRDGSSRYGPENRFGNFGAIGMGWLFSKEKFFQTNLPFLSHGKLRGSYGSTGNDQIKDFAFIPSYSAYPYSYQNLTGLVPTSLPNPAFGWEKVKKFESAIELGFLKDRIVFNGTYYRHRTSNQIVNYPLPTITGGASVTANFPAIVENTGIEMELITDNVRNQHFHWTSSFNITFPKNKLVSFPGIENTIYATKYEVGKSLSVLKAYAYAGVDPQTGLYDFKDLDGNGAMTAPDDYMARKEIVQTYFGGFQNTFTYINFQLDLFFQFVKQNGRNYLPSFNMPGVFSEQSNQLTVVFDRWQKGGDNAPVQKFSQNFASQAYAAYRNLQTSDGIISDASYIRLKNVSLSYTPKLKGKLNVRNIKIYLQCQNLFTITNYLGLDPETQALLPPLRVITAGFQLSL